MSIQKSTTPRFEVLVTVIYVPEESKPEQGYHFFGYKVTIKNTGTMAAQLLNRHWIITDGLGRVEEVKGPGVIGKQPNIQPGTDFTYESACPLSTSTGSMRGSYQMKADNGDTFEIEIPEFHMIAPHGLH